MSRQPREQEDSGANLGKLLFLFVSESNALQPGSLLQLAHAKRRAFGGAHLRVSAGVHPRQGNPGGDRNAHQEH